MKNYCHQIFLEECKYVVKEKTVLKYITADVFVLMRKNLKKKLIVKNKLRMIIIFNDIAVLEKSVFERVILTMLFLVG